MQNHLKNQTSPYLLQHAEDKPIFLSIGYSTCHWCHVMAHESFEDEQVAKILNEQLILQPKETYDGAVFSGNSAMAYNLVRLYLITGKKRWKDLAEQQLRFLSAEAESYPVGHAMFLLALSEYVETPDKVTIVVKDRQDVKNLSCRIPLGTVICILETPTKEYPLKNERTTFYMCKGRSCLPPVNEPVDFEKEVS